MLSEPLGYWERVFAVGSLNATGLCLRVRVGDLPRQGWDPEAADRSRGRWQLCSGLSSRFA